MRHEYCEGHGRGPFWLKVIGFTILGLIGAIIFSLLFGLAVQWLWNHTVTSLFGWPVLGYWQAVGLLLLAKLFFGHFGRPHRHPPFPHHHARRWVRHNWRESECHDSSKADSPEAGSE